MKRFDWPRRAPTLAIVLIAAAVFACSLGCGGSQLDGADSRSGKREGGGPGHRGVGARTGMPGGSTAAVPVEVATATRRSISSFLETNGTLEAENEVDLVARTSGPIVDLRVEEGDAVRKNQIIARIDEVEHRVELEIARVELHRARQAYERAKSLSGENLISSESYEQAESDFGAARAQVEAREILLGYTEIRAPFAGLIVARYIKLAEQVGPDMPLFRISDFDPLLCPVQVPERSLPLLRKGQRAYLLVDPYPREKFEASVLRISPVIDAATGTIKVTLQVGAKEMLRPGMFSRVFIETATRQDAVVIPKAALSLDSIGDTVFVADGGTVSRRDVALGFKEGDFVEVISGVADGERVVVVGQDGLSDGTPIHVLEPAPAAK